MSIQAEKGRGLLHVRAGEGRGYFVYFFLLQPKLQHLLERLFPTPRIQARKWKASGFSSLSDRRPFGHADVRGWPRLQLVMKRIICLVIKNRTHTNKPGIQPPSTAPHSSLIRASDKYCHPVPPQKEEAVDLPFNNFPKCYK